MNVFYIINLILFTVLSWGFVDANAPLPRIAALHPILFFQTVYPTVFYSITVILLFGWYLWVLRSVRAGTINNRGVWRLMLVTSGVLIVSYPALSNDLFNYIATAKVAFLYKENPYIVMPIDIPNEPMLSFLHAANKVALYGPVWILLTAVPFAAGLGNLLFTVFTFKVFIAGWYLLLCYLLWRQSGKKPWTLAFFGLNPLVTLSTLVDGHNDVVMMALALGALMAIRRRRFMMAVLLLIASIFIKGATIVLIPLLFLKKPSWYAASVAMYGIFFLSPIREEIYAWYFIWPLTFLALAERETILHAVSYGFSFGLMLRIVPFLYTRSWVGITPMVKKIVTFVPVVVSLLIYEKTPRR